MIPLQRDRWLAEVDAFVRRFAERAPLLDRCIAELEPSGPWVDPDRPDPVLDAAYQSGIVRRGQ